MAVSGGLGIIGRFLGNAVSETVAFAAGYAMGPVLSPPVQLLKNEVNSKYPFVPPEAAQMAEGVAHGKIDAKQGSQWAAEHGYSQDAFDAMVAVAEAGMPLGNAFDAWRRGELTDAEFDTQLDRSGIAETWFAKMRALHDVLLSPQELAVMVQRGIVKNDDLLPVGPPTATGKVPPMPQIGVDPVDEAGKQGWTKDRLAGLARIIGLPASPDLAARMVFRGIIEETDFYRAISEGNTRNEWAKFLFEGFRQIPTAHDGIEYRLRGWTDDAGMYAQTARHGMSKDDTDLLFKVLGRPLSFHQVFIGLRRGGEYDGPTDAIDPAFLKSLRESNIRPEWYNLAWAQRYSYPTAFVLRTLTEAGDITGPQVEQILLDEGWEPNLAKLVSAKWAATKTKTAADHYVTKADTQLWTATHKAYVKNGLAQTQVTPALDMLAISATDQQTIFQRWDMEKTVDADVAPAA